MGSQNYRRSENEIEVILADREAILMTDESSLGIDKRNRNGVLQYFTMKRARHLE